MKNTGTIRFAYLMGILASAFYGGSLNHKVSPRQARRELHYMSGENPIYFPRRKKLKGWQKELKRKNK
jgi:hypothetical protein